MKVLRKLLFHCKTRFKRFYRCLQSIDKGETRLHVSTIPDFFFKFRYEQLSVCNRSFVNTYLSELAYKYHFRFTYMWRKLLLHRLILGSAWNHLERGTSRPNEFRLKRQQKFDRRAVNIQCNLMMFNARWHLITVICNSWTVIYCDV